MKNKSFSPVGSMHPVLFFVFVYAVALFFSIFICSSLFYSCEARSSAPLIEKTEQVPGNTETPGTAIAVSQ